MVVVTKGRSKPKCYSSGIKPAAKLYGNSNYRLSWVILAIEGLWAGLALRNTNGR